MLPKIYCLMGAGVTDEVATVLMFTALNMYRESKSRQSFRTLGCEGLITTQFAHASLGVISGVLFEAEVEDDLGKRKAEIRARLGRSTGARP